MSKSQTDLLNEDFRNGYNAGVAGENPHFLSSPAWEAFELGRWMHHTGRPISRVRPSRGSNWKTEHGMTVAIRYTRCEGKTVFKLERTA
jgi:hypothetical protein